MPPAALPTSLAGKAGGLRSPGEAPASLAFISQITPNICLFSKHFTVTMECFTYATVPALFLPHMPAGPPMLTLSPRATAELLPSPAHGSGRPTHSIQLPWEVSVFLIHGMLCPRP